jgi:multidrug efflux pump subunit AcrA (membrane-fusion protein)
MLICTNIISRFKHGLKQRPLVSFYGLLGVLLATIALVSFLSRPTVINDTKVVQPKPVTVHTIGSTSTLSTPAMVEKSGLVTVVAQTAGIVTNLPVKEGLSVVKGQNLLTISTTYGGANVAAIQAALAKKQVDFQADTLDLQKNVINDQRRIAEANRDNNEALREISDRSLGRTREQLALTQDIIDYLDQNIETLESATQSAENTALVFSTKQLQSQFISARNQVQALIDQTEYQVNSDNPPTQLADLSYEVTIKQLDLQEKSLMLNKEVADLNYRLALINASLNTPAAPFAGTVERVHVRYGQAVNPGMPLVTLSGAAESSVIVASIPASTAKLISRLESARMVFQGQTYTLPIAHISAVFPNQLSRVVLSLPSSLPSRVTDQQMVQVMLPVGYPDSQSTLPVIPIDAVHITQEAAYVFSVKDNKAVTKIVELGRVMGDKVMIVGGLTNGDVIILERNVRDGDEVVVN